MSDVKDIQFSHADTILVTGATGFTGSHLIRKLCGTGATVRAIARSSSNLDALSDLSIDWYTGDVFDQDVVGEASQGVHYVFHVAAAFREAKVGDDVYHKVHVLSTKHLVESIQSQIDAGHEFKRFVHVSTAGVHGHIEHPPADESYRFSPGDLYQQTKVEGEAYLQQFAKAHQFPMTIIRPCAIYGPGDRRLLKLFKMAKLPFCPIFGMNNKGLYHLIHVEDLSQFMCLSATDESADGEVFIVGNPTASSIELIIRRIAEQLGTSPTFLRIPVSPVMLAAWLCEKLFKPFDIEPPIYPRRVAFFTKDRSFNTGKMKTITSFQYQYSNDTGLSELADWYVEKGWL